MIPIVFCIHLFLFSHFFFSRWNFTWWWEAAWLPRALMPFSHLYSDTLIQLLLIFHCIYTRFSNKEKLVYVSSLVEKYCGIALRCSHGISVSNTHFCVSYTWLCNYFSVSKGNERLFKSPSAEPAAIVPKKKIKLFVVACD